VASDHATCNDLNNIDVVDSVMCLSVVEICTRVIPAVPFRSGTRAGWSSELGRLVRPGKRSRPLLAYFQHKGLDRCDELRAVVILPHVGKTVPHTGDGRHPQENAYRSVHGECQHRGRSCVQDCLRRRGSIRMSDTYGYGICCQHGAGEFKTTVNGEPIATISSGVFRDIVGESVGVLGAVLTPPSTAGWMSRTMTTRKRRIGRYSLTTGSRVSVSATGLLLGKFLIIYCTGICWLLGKVPRKQITMAKTERDEQKDLNGTC
jgi:hypothetical protein